MQAAGVDKWMSGTLVAFILGIAAGCILGAYLTIATLPQRGLFTTTRTDHTRMSQTAKAPRRSDRLTVVAL
ncbi:MAG TPA: hypothetical protein VFB15_11965 [Candidatus Binataceae bacterium]|jgi:hypothetical protein|nr:hypothetical protein [Candidatus Binataceae bacterium]